MQQTNRRQFIRQIVFSAATLGCVPLLDLFTLPVLAAISPAVVKRTGPNISDLVEQVLEPLGGMGHFIKPGDRVVVKPNIGWDRTPEQGANTHPEIVKTVIEHCLQAGAAEVRVFDNTCNDPRRCYTRSGIQAAVDSLKTRRAKIEHMDRRAYQDINIHQGQDLSSWSFYRPAIEADKFINLPVAKTHSIAVLTLGMKNIMGVIGGNRGKLHRNIGDSVTDINLVVQSDLTIVDATRIMVANGPQGGRLSDVERRDTLIASSDIVAADSVAATLFGYRPDQIPTVATAARRGLGVMDLGRIQML
ncbi:MAG: DUF362 domain-containing protein [Deltaproteobacteria bacterium]|jgi:uncharacterized protein (DUF362 family)|nr:DUF362 domain-containing protein [Deltaproteobacteria bacterium]MCW8891861.1 DUF362 domain-containing protein [Deltaproteobacteria bacterium]MCW9050512.1 DUF362 domain-containing protein [Deltaproteobacteria bacterium]